MTENTGGFVPPRLEGSDAAADGTSSHPRDTELLDIPSVSDDLDDEVDIPDPYEQPVRASEIAAQAQVVEMARKGGVESKFHRQLEASLSTEAARVLNFWLRTGRIFSQARRRVIGADLKPTPAELEQLERDRQLREDLVQEILTRAIEKFREQMREGTGWSPDGGASLLTYFITNCVLKFIDVFRKFRTANDTETQLRSKAVADFVVHARGELHLASAESVDTVLGDRHIAQILFELSDRDRRILAAYHLGFSPAEIANAYVDVKNDAVVRAALHRLKSKYSWNDRLAGAEDSK
ncbi:RNA polymerase sigma factor [Nocardia salmonicida]|uniref:RNA polymerase sigma factor n=1 Tax=Nocardia salmonicida TaxID=53431 RepID=UPI0033FEB2DB